MTASGDQQEQQERLVEHVTCLGCGCACDDIGVRVRGGSIVETRNACALGAAWFGDGRVPAAVRVDGRDADTNAAIDAIAALLNASTSPLIYVAPELSSEAQRAATAIADALQARLDSITSSTAFASILAAQERGRAGATLGEVRNRADVVVFWGVDPNERYPRFWSRYAPEPAGLQVPEGRRSRTVIAVDVGDARGPVDADVRIAVPKDEEVATLTALDAVVRNPSLVADGPLWSRARDLATRLTVARYLVIVVDGESPDAATAEDLPAALGRLRLARAGAMMSLAQALNGPTRCALSTLRGGGNRPGADSVFTAQTGYPMAVDFARGYPTYRPYDLTLAGPDAVLIVGDAARVPASVTREFGPSSRAVIGPRASSDANARITIDTGVAGVHVGGTALRMDDIPLPLRPSIDGAADPVDLLRALLLAVTAEDQSEDRPLRQMNSNHRKGWSSDRRDEPAR